ncbi:glutamine--fructose-6-phosphate transaminase (isomerizing) [Halobacteriales archaeon Cl-PHB]
MCGIIGRIGTGESLSKLVQGLENLEYRGYDSAGIAVQNGSGIEVEKCSGRVDDLATELEWNRTDGHVGIGHTRWSTHGPPTDENAHPHTDEPHQPGARETADVAVVHNGVIENYDALRRDLQADGVTFSSETDTEVVPHLIERQLADGADPEEAFRRAVDTLEGSFAIAALVRDEEAIFAARDQSPLVVGFGDGENFLASDVPAFLEFTDQVCYLEDGDVARLEPTGVRITDADGDPVERDVDTVDWDPDETGKGAYDHYMLKEINSQPTALTNTIEGRVNGAGADPDLRLEEFPPGTFEDISTVQLVACGTSYHAAMFGQTLLKGSGVRTEAIRANEYQNRVGPIDDETLVVAVTQSGETADTLSALQEANSRGARTLAVTNVLGSTATREADDALFIRAGPEIGVAATKTFSSQAVTLALLADRLAHDVATATPREDRDELFAALTELPDDLRQVLESTDAESVARRYIDSESYFFIGHGIGNAVAKEGALKFKEITYEHAEGFASGELKHGPLALVTGQTPLFAVLTGDEDRDAKTLTNAREAQTRGAPVVAVGPEGEKAARLADGRLSVPDTHPVWACLLANVQLQLVSYHAGAQLDRAIDKPRNLAKSVTVE